MKTNRTTISRGKNRAVDDRMEVYKILDEGLVCHISFVRDGYPVVLPSSYARHNDYIILHGGYESPFFQSLARADDLCLTVTLLDGLVLAKSAYSHSVNYRSAVIFGKASLIENPSEKLECLKILVNHVLANRWDTVRPPNEKELNSTMVLNIPILEYSAKMRTGDPTVITSDENFPVWSGVLPLSVKRGNPIADNFSGIISPDTEILNYDRLKYRS